MNVQTITMDCEMIQKSSYRNIPVFVANLTLALAFKLGAHWPQASAHLISFVYRESDCVCVCACACVCACVCLP